MQTHQKTTLNDKGEQVSDPYCRKSTAMFGARRRGITNARFEQRGERWVYIVPNPNQIQSEATGENRVQ